LPELPEVETTKKGIVPFLKQRSIVSIDVRNGALRWPVSSEVFQIKNQLVQDVFRRGKYIIIQLAQGSVLIHLGMSGSLRVVDSSVPIQKHDHVDLNLAGNKTIRFNDPRRFGSILWAENWQEHVLISSLGLEPLDDDFNGDYLYQKAKNRKVAIKQFIMNGKLVVGVGNIYANEALFLAGIDPTRGVHRVSRKRMRLLADVIKQVLAAAIKQGGTTLKDFVGSDGKPGYFKQELNVYGRAGKKCVRCEALLTEIRQNNRATVYCVQCQK
jgi:formamidopyrimidine-DNA glycosylase